MWSPSTPSFDAKRFCKMFWEIGVISLQISKLCHASPKAICDESMVCEETTGNLQ